MLKCREDFNFGFKKIDITPGGKCDFSSVKYSVAYIIYLLAWLLINNSTSGMQLGVLCKVGGYILMVFDFS